MLRDKGVRYRVRVLLVSVLPRNLFRASAHSTYEPHFFVIRR